MRSAILLLLGFVVGLAVAKGLTRETVTLFAAILAAIIGFFAYGWQRKVDRSEAVLLECRKVYREFIAAAEQLLAVHCSDADDPTKDAETARYREAYQSLMIYGTDEIIAAAKPYLMQVVRYTDPEFQDQSSPQEVLDLRNKLETLASMMRDDCNNAKSRGQSI
ncbi:hypothetical protein [Albidovulum aquaemixtae]|nr:hypothetical protein [Defluviimonas aquaemixtae]